MLEAQRINRSGAVRVAHLGDLAHHKLLLVSSHAGASLGVLVGPDQQLDQAGDGPLLAQSAVIGRAQGQVTDQTDGRLEVEEKGTFFWSMMIRISDRPIYWPTDICVYRFVSICFIYRQLNHDLHKCSFF